MIFKKTFFGLLLLVASISLFHSCELDDDLDPNSDDPAAFFLGSWSVTDNATKVNYSVEIIRNPLNSTEVLLQNFAGSGDPNVRALVVGTTLRLISVFIGDDWKISGTGKLSNQNRIDFYYTLEIGGDEEERFALFSR